MAESLGAAVLTVSVDDRLLRSGLQAVAAEAQRTAQLVQQTFSRLAGDIRLPNLQNLNARIAVDASALDQSLQTAERLRDVLEQLRRLPPLPSTAPPPPGLPPGLPPRPPAEPPAIPPLVNSANPRTILEMRERVSELTQALERLPIGSAAFNDLRARAQAAADELRRVTAAADPRSIDGMRQRVAELNAALSRVAVGSAAFDDLRARAEAAAAELRRATTSADPRSIQALRDRIGELNGALSRVAIGSAAFDDLRARVEAANIELRNATSAADPRSLDALRQRVADLNRELQRVDVGSAAFRTLRANAEAASAELRRATAAAGLGGPSVSDLLARRAQLQERLQRFEPNTAGFERLAARIRQINDQIESINRSRLSPNTDTRSLDAMRQRVADLSAALGRVGVGSQQFQRLQRDLNDASRELASASGAARGASAAFQGLLSGLAGFGAGAAVIGFFRGSVKSAVELETITRKLSVTLGPQGASGALTFTRGLADDLGLSFKTLAGGFGSFTAAATAANVPMQTQRDLFAAVAKAGQSLGLSNDAISGSLLALQQVASKGTVAMEELRGQLGERLPIALAATARGLGVNQRELIKLVESGKLTADRFFPALTKGLNELTAGAGGVPTAAQNFEKLGNAFDALQTSFGESILPDLVEQVKNLTKALEGYKVALDAAKLGLGGPAGGLGLNSTEVNQAVGTLRNVQRQNNLSDSQVRALFTDAAKRAGIEFIPPRSPVRVNEGFDPEQDGFNGILNRLGLRRPGFRPRGDQLQRALDLVPGLAQQFRDRNPDRKGDELAKAAKEAQEQERRRQAAEKASTAAGLTQIKTKNDLELKGLQARIAAAKQLDGLEGLDRQRLESELALNEKILAVRLIQADIQRELAKPTGTGQGARSPVQLEQLQGQQKKAVLELRQAYEQAGRDLVRAAREAAELSRSVLDVFRSRGDTLQDLGRQGAAAIDGRNSPIDVLTPADAVREAQRRVAAQVQGLGDGISDAARDAVRAAEALRDAKERRAGGELIPLDQLAKFQSDADTAAQRLTVAGLNAGRALKDGATEAAKQLRDAKANFNDLVRSNFNSFTKPFQDEQIALARRELQAGFDTGKLSPNIPVRTIEELFSAAGLANRIIEADRQVVLATNLKAAADAAAANSGTLVENSAKMGLLTKALIDLERKRWEVNVAVQPPTAAIPNV